MEAGAWRPWWSWGGELEPETGRTFRCSFGPLDGQIEILLCVLKDIVPFESASQKGKKGEERECERGGGKKIKGEGMRRSEGRRTKKGEERGRKGVQKKGRKEDEGGLGKD